MEDLSEVGSHMANPFAFKGRKEAKRSGETVFPNSRETESEDLPAARRLTLAILRPK
jgi:hypothetical protein